MHDHDLFHDLAQLISRFECCVFDTNTKNDISTMRRLRLHLAEEEETKELADEEETTEIPKELGMAKKLRVIFIEGSGRSKIGNVSLLMNLKSLRVLSLSGIWNEELLYMIAKLKHLRYLEIGDIDGYDVVLPACITRLYHLQTIKLGRSLNLKQFPSNMEKFINLRHFDTGYFAAEMPKRIGKLRFLQTLSFYRVGKEKGCYIEELKDLDQIRGELRVEGLENVKSREEAMNANLITKRLLSKLDLDWSYRRGNNNNDEEVLEGLQPHPNLKKLNIEGFKGVRLPRWLAHQMLPNLVSVTLYSNSKCEHLPAFGLFTSLRFLCITAMDSPKSIGFKFYRGNVAHLPPPSFPSLKILVLEHLNNLEEWVDLPTSSSSPFPLSSLSSSFPSLEILIITYCSKLRTMPTFFPSLRQLNLQGSHSVVEMMLGKCEQEEEEENTNNIGELIPTFSTNLRQLSLYGDTFPSLPKGIQCFTALESLVIGSFPNMEALPEWLGNLTSLQRLEIRRCERLMYMPSAEAMRSLCKRANLSVYTCPLLIERCTKDQGQEWYKISHIPIIEINYQNIQKG